MSIRKTFRKHNPPKSKMLFINDGFILSRGKPHTGRIQEKEQIQQEKEAFKYD